MSDKRLTNSFKSYVDYDQVFDSSAEDSFLEQLAVKLLPGETVIAEAQRVLMFTPVTGQKTGKLGTLTVTNFRLSFTSSEEKTDDLYYQGNLLLGENDVCLSNVDSLYLFTGEKKRRLIPGHRVPDKVKALFIMCKNMRVLTFSFKLSPIGHAKTLTNVLLHHAFPRRHQLLFAYDYKEEYFNYNKETPTFRTYNEWNKELARISSKGWRLTSVNKDFKLSTNMPQWFVVGKDVHDCQLTLAAQHFRNKRLPVWCFSTPFGAALARMADLRPTITDRDQENIMLETIRKSHPRHIPPVVLDLNKELPSPKELEVSYNKLRELCAPGSSRQFWAQDSHYYSLLDNSKWLLHVSNCLYKASEAADTLHKEISVVIQETDGRDMCCVISSLAMLLLDSYFRTLYGFQSLIQKEWVAMGHQFGTRLGHVYNVEMQQSPVFLLFLDCVWQLVQQFPSCFEFTQTYLTTLWDSAHVSIFDTFLFDCDRDRLLAAEEPNNPLTLRSVWDWGEMFSDRDITLFFNPLYNRSSCSYSPLNAHCGISDLQIWSQCYFRFLPLLELIGGGEAQIDLAARSLVSQITGNVTFNSASKLGSFFPFTRWKSTTQVPSSALLMSTLTLNNSDILDCQSVLTVTDHL